MVSLPSIVITQPKLRMDFRMYSSGNKCGHDPLKPRLISYRNPHRIEDWDDDNDRDDFGHKKKSRFFYDVDAALDDFYNFPRMLPNLGMMWKEDGSQKKRRSELRESTTAVLKTIIHHMDMTSNRFGYPSKDGFIYYDIKFIQKHSGLSYSRVKRALKALVRSGYIERKKRWTEREYGKFKSLTTATVVNVKMLFSHLDIMDAFLETAKFLTEKLKSAAKEIGTTASRMLRCAVLDFNGNKPKRSANKDPDDYPISHRDHYLYQLPAHKQRDFQMQVIKVKESNPSLDNTSVYQQAFKAVS